MGNGERDERIEAACRAFWGEDYWPEHVHDPADPDKWREWMGRALDAADRGAVDALEDFIAEVAAPTGRLRLAEHAEGDTLLGIVERGRASLAALRGQ